MRILIVTLLSGLCAPLSAQEPVASETARAAFERIDADYTAVFDAFMDAARELSSSPEFVEAREKRDAEKLKAMQSRLQPVDPKPFVERCRRAIERFADDADTVFLHGWLVAHGGDAKVVEAALATIEDRYLTSDRLGPIARDLPRSMRWVGGARCRAFLDRVIERNPGEAIQAEALFARAIIARYDRNATAEDKATVDVDLARVAKLVPGTTLAMWAEGDAFERERLQVGMSAPEIEGEDLDGKRFKLSDYRGKVVLLDFWGDW